MTLLKRLRLTRKTSSLQCIGPSASQWLPSLSLSIPDWTCPDKISQPIKTLFEKTRVIRVVSKGETSCQSQSYGVTVIGALSSTVSSRFLAALAASELDLDQ